MAARDLGIPDGRRAFGADPANYDSARPGYPAEVFEVLRERCGLDAGTSTFEIGAGTGLATRGLLASGASPLVAVEPDERLVAALRERTPNPSLRIVAAPFEDAELLPAIFDLGASATAFHWLEQRSALAKVATLLRPGGWWAMWWNVFGDPDKPDPFHEATKDLLSGLGSNPSRHEFGLDREARFADLEAVGAFDAPAFACFRWTLVLTPPQVRALYATYSQFSVLTQDERNRLLDALAEIASKEFGGRVERNMCTPIYMARRR